jgi:hypothetical protein
VRGGAADAAAPGNEQHAADAVQRHRRVDGRGDVGGVEEGGHRGDLGLRARGGPTAGVGRPVAVEVDSVRVGAAEAAAAGGEIGLDGGEAVDVDQRDGDDPAIGRRGGCQALDQGERGGDADPLEGVQAAEDRGGAASVVGAEGHAVDRRAADGVADDRDPGARQRAQAGVDAGEAAVDGEGGRDAHAPGEGSAVSRCGSGRTG